MNFIITGRWLWIIDHNLGVMVFEVIHQSEKTFQLITLIVDELGWEIFWLKTNVKIMLEEVEFQFLQVQAVHGIQEARVDIMLI